MVKIEIFTYGRNRKKFQKLFPMAKFEGYESNIKYCWFTLSNVPMRKIKRICKANKIKIA
jgi:hypothetical protein